MQLKIDNCRGLSGKILAWPNFDESALEAIVRDFEKVPREEVTGFYSPFLTDELVQSLLALGERHRGNADMLCNVISATGNLIARYGANPSDEAYSFLLKFARRPKVDYFVAIHLDVFPQFNESKNKWDYIFSILDIRPKRKSFNVFFSVVMRILNRKEAIGQECFDRLAVMLDGMLADDSKSMWTKMEYSHALELLGQCPRDEQT